MPRPPEVGVGKVVGTKLSQRDAELLELLAKREGIPTSKLVRRILLEYLKTHFPEGESIAVESGAAPDPDPIAEAELADFKDALEKLEKSVRAFEYRAQPLLKSLASGTRALSSEDYRLKIALADEAAALKKRWYKLRRWYTRLPKTREMSERMASLLQRIQTVARYVT